MRGRAIVGLALVVGLGGLGSALRAAAQEAREAPAAPGLEGRWEGTVLFATGHRAWAEAELAREGEAWTGTWKLVIQDEEGEGQPQAGKVGFRRLEGGAFRAELPQEGTTFEGRLAPAGTHAEAALLGTFQGKQAGVAILWRYRR